MWCRKGSKFLFTISIAVFCCKTCWSQLQFKQKKEIMCLLKIQNIQVSPIKGRKHRNVLLCQSSLSKDKMPKKRLIFLFFLLLIIQKNIFRNNNTNFSNFFLMKLRQRGVKLLFHLKDETYNQALVCWHFKFWHLSSRVIYCNGKLDAECVVYVKMQ